MSISLSRQQALFFRKLPRSEQLRILSDMTAGQLLELDAAFEVWANDGQVEPICGGWNTWLMLAGRGFGKTRAGAEWILALAASRPVRIALVGATIDEARSVMVEGSSGLVTLAARRMTKLKFEPSKRLLAWPNGSIATLYSGENPDGLRGPEHHFAWYLTFELFADEGGKAIGDLLRDASGGIVDIEDERIVEGYALYGSDLGSAIEPLAEAYSLDLSDSGGRFRDRAGEPLQHLPGDILGASIGSEKSRRAERKRLAAASVPSELTLVYHDPARDYQSGLARAAIPADHRAARALALPIVSDAPAAKGLAETALQRAWAGRETLLVKLPLAFAVLEPGDLLALAGITGEWLVERVAIEQMIVSVQARATASRAGSRPADPGRPVSPPDVVATPSRLVLLDLADWPAAGGPSVQLAVTSPSGGYRAVPLEVSIGGAIVGMGSAAREAVSGTAEAPLPPVPAALIDRVSIVEVTLANPDHWLESRDDAALAGGANIAAIGEEIVQFGRAEPLGAGRFRLSRLLRGRGGTEHAIGGHGAGEAFVLLNPAALVTVPIAAGHIGSEVSVTAHGPANAAVPPSVTRQARGEAVRPLSPCHLAARRDLVGRLLLSWIGRARSGWAWLDGVEAMPDGDFQGFRISISGSGGALERSTLEPQATIEAGDIAGLGPLLTIEVRQAGAFGLSRPTTLTIEA